MSEQSSPNEPDLTIFPAALGDDMAQLENMLKVPENVNLRNKAGETVLDVAKARKKTDAAKLIKSYGGLTHIELAKQLGEEVPRPILNKVIGIRSSSKPKCQGAVAEGEEPYPQATDMAQVRGLRSHFNQEVAGLRMQIAQLECALQQQKDAVSAVRF